MSRFAKMIILLALAALTAVGALFFWGRDARIPASGDLTGLVASSTLAGGDFPNPSDLGISLDITPDEPPPGLDRQIIKSAGVDDAVFAIAQGAISDIVVELKREPVNYDYWVELGNYRNIIKDLSGAEEAWNYALRIRPTQATAYVNLGTLYERDYKNYPKAEEYYLTVLELEQNNLSSHMRLFDLYRFFYKEKRSQADDVLISALERFPDNREILVNLSRFLAAEGDFARARTYYDQAIAAAADSGLVADLIAERNRLPR